MSQGQRDIVVDMPFHRTSGTTGTFREVERALLHDVTATFMAMRGKTVSGLEPDYGLARTHIARVRERLYWLERTIIQLQDVDISIADRAALDEARRYEPAEEERITQQRRVEAASEMPICWHIDPAEQHRFCGLNQEAHRTSVVTPGHRFITAQEYFAGLNK